MSGGVCFPSFSRRILTFAAMPEKPGMGTMVRPPLRLKFSTVLASSFAGVVFRVYKTKLAFIAPPFV